jgi:hypothetical protein
LKALLPAIHDREFENLPPVYQMVSPLVQTPSPSLQSELDITIQALARRSPTETAYFLRQVLGTGTGINTVRMVRRALPAFSEELQEGLKTAMKNA